MRRSVGGETQPRPHEQSAKRNAQGMREKHSRGHKIALPKLTRGTHLIIKALDGQGRRSAVQQIQGLPECVGRSSRLRQTA